MSEISLAQTIYDKFAGLSRPIDAMGAQKYPDFADFLGNCEKNEFEDPCGDKINLVISVGKEREFQEAIKAGSAHLAEAYINNVWEFRDQDNQLRPDYAFHFLTNLFQTDRYTQGRKNIFTQVFGMFKSLVNQQTIESAAAQIHSHYDEMDSMIQSAVDDLTQAYSSAKFEDDFEIDEQALKEIWNDPDKHWEGGKNPMILALEEAELRIFSKRYESMNLQDGSTFLEIGCGSGAFTEYAIRRAGREGKKVKGVGITISKEQRHDAKNRARGLNGEPNISDQMNIIYLDYRKANWDQILGVGKDHRFDAIVSPEMIEAVGEKNWGEYAHVVEKNLKPGGKFVLQVINSDVKSFRADSPSSMSDGLTWIVRHIFPGGDLLTDEEMDEVFVKNHNLVSEDSFSFGKSYAKTLRIWQARFHNHRNLHKQRIIANLDKSLPDAKKEMIAEKSVRIFEYYLMCSAASFEVGGNEEKIGIDVAQRVFKKPIESTPT